MTVKIGSRMEELDGLDLAHSLSKSSIQTWMNAASRLMTNCCAITSVTTTLVVSTAPAVTATYYTPTTRAVQVRFPGYWSHDPLA